MSCNGCRVLRKGCGDGCVLRPCLQWIESGESQGFATLFVAKFFGRSGLMDFLTSVPHTERTSCGRTVNPVHGAVGLLWSGKWHVCQEAVQTVLSGGTLRNRYTNIRDDENDIIRNNKVSKRSRSNANNSCSSNLRSSMQHYHSLTREDMPTSNGCLESDQEVRSISTQSHARHCGYNLDTLYKRQNLTSSGVNLIETFDSHYYDEVNFDLHNTPLSKSKLYPHKRPKLNIFHEQQHMTNKRSDIDYSVKANYNAHCIPNECRDTYLYKEGDEKIKLDLGLKSVDHIVHQGASYGNNINNDNCSVSSPSSGSMVTTLESLQQSSIASHHQLFSYDDISNMPHGESPQTNFKLLNLLV